MDDVRAVTVVEDNDACFRREQETAEALLKSRGISKVSKETITAEKKNVQKLIDQCELCVTIQRKVAFAENAWHARLGVLSIKCPESHKAEFTENVLLGQQHREFYLYISLCSTRHLLYFETEVEVEKTAKKQKMPLAYFHVSSEAPFSCFDGLQSSCFRLELQHVDPETLTMR